MKEFENNAFFWQKIDTLLFSSPLEIFHKKGESHPEYAHFIFPVDVGMLQETSSQKSDGIFAFKGTKESSGCNAVVVSVDILKKELEVKLLIDCTEEEEEEILKFLNQADLQKAILLQRGSEIPSWGLTD